MTEMYIEPGGKKTIAWSLSWPGWCRIRTGEAAAVQALLETEARYRLIAQHAGLAFAPVIWWWWSGSQAMPARPGECLLCWPLLKANRWMPRPHNATWRCCGQHVPCSKRRSPPLRQSYGKGRKEAQKRLPSLLDREGYRL